MSGSSSRSTASIDTVGSTVVASASTVNTNTSTASETMLRPRFTTTFKSSELIVDPRKEELFMEWRRRRLEKIRAALANPVMRSEYSHRASQHPASIKRDKDSMTAHALHVKRLMPLTIPENPPASRRKRLTKSRPKSRSTTAVNVAGGKKTKEKTGYNSSEEANVMDHEDNNDETMDTSDVSNGKLRASAKEEVIRTIISKVKEEAMREIQSEEQART